MCLFHKGNQPVLPVAKILKCFTTYFIISVIHANLHMRFIFFIIYMLSFGNTIQNIIHQLFPAGKSLENGNFSLAGVCCQRSIPKIIVPVWLTIPILFIIFSHSLYLSLCFFLLQLFK